MTMTTGDFVKLFEAFYTRFVLRDFFGKIIPGLIFLFSVAVVLTQRDAATCNSSALIVMDAFSKASTVMTILILGLAWIAAFAIQGLWELMALFCSRMKARSACIGKRYAELRTLDSYDRHQPEFERLIVIEEACRNGALSLLVSVIVLGAAALGEPTWSGMFGLAITLCVGVVASLILLLFVVSLGWMACLHLSRQDDFLKDALDVEKQKEQPAEPTL